MIRRCGDLRINPPRTKLATLQVYFVAGLTNLVLDSKSSEELLYVLLHNRETTVTFPDRLECILSTCACGAGLASFPGLQSPSLVPRPRGSKVTVHIRLLYLHISSPWVIVLVEVCSLPLLSSHSSTITSYRFQVVSMGSLVCIELLTMPSLLISSPSAWSGLFMKISSSVHLFSVLFTFSCD